MRVRQAAAPSPRRAGTLAAVAVAAALVGASVLLRLPLVTYAGAPDQPAVNAYMFGHFGAYSDIASLFFRDHLDALHRAPYFDYKLEYPVLTGGFIWLASFAQGSVGHYLLASSAGLLVFAGIAVAALRSVEGANAWLFAAAPALAFYAVVNWDLLGIGALAVALALYDRGRDVSASVALGVAVWTKFFPIVILPVILAVRLAEHRWRAAVGTLFGFLAASALVNLPVALQPAAGGGFVVRPFWPEFFNYTSGRDPLATLWTHVDLPVSTINLLTGGLLVLGVATLTLIALRAGRGAGRLLVPLSAAALLWLFATAKVYSPQYALWIVAALAAAGAPVWTLVLFSAVDAAIFLTAFGDLSQGATVGRVENVAYDVRQLVTLGLVAWAVYGLRRRVRNEAATAEPAAAAAG